MTEVRVHSVAEFIVELAKHKPRNGCTRFFRGHADYVKYLIRPGIYRSLNLIRNESNLISEAIVRCPADFPESSSFFERLVKLQHYGLPTRLFDVTTNAMAALYFACREKEKTTGEVLVFDIPKGHVKYYSSDTVSVIANLARRPYRFDLQDLPSEQSEFNEHVQVARLLHDIREDKPGFQPLIEIRGFTPSHLRSSKTGQRANRSSGWSFLVVRCRRQEEAIRPGTPRLGCLWSGLEENHLLEQIQDQGGLESFGMSEQTLFPELDYQTKSIVQRFSGRYKRKAKSTRRTSAK